MLFFHDNTTVISFLSEKYPALTYEITNAMGFTNTFSICRWAVQN